MKLEIEVKRRRFSVTQGQADVYVNGEMVISFGDTIEIINDGQPYYSEKIGNWASIVPDSKCMGFSLLRTSEFFVIRKMEMSETKTHLLCGWSQIVIQKITFPLQ